MPTTIQPTMDIIHTDTIASGSAVTIALPGGAGTWYLTAIQALGDGTTTLAVTDGAANFLTATAVPAAGLSAVSAVPDTATGATITLTAAGGGTGVKYVKLAVSSDTGNQLTTS